MQIRATAIEFDSTASFRRLKNMYIPLSARITLICGHNGAGKSTILGVLSCLSGITDSNIKSYFGQTFDADISKIIYISVKSVLAAKAAGSLSEPKVHYEIEDARAISQVTKKCRLTNRGRQIRARSVPESVPHKAYDAPGLSFGADAKVPLPTLYVGMVRVLPVGETPDDRVQNKADLWVPDDLEFLYKFYTTVMPNVGATKGSITVNKVKQTNKFSTHATLPYGPREVSVGQDSLGAIVTAVASFHRLKREMGDKYPGGLLIVDELDAGLHPHAIRELVGALRDAADDLNLQIVATTHSPRLVEAIHPDGLSKGRTRRVDKVVYLKNSDAPVYDSDMSLASILRDMDLEPPPEKPEIPVIKVYFEDDEAHHVYKILTRPGLIRSIGRELGVTIKAMPLGVGCSSLALLPQKDDYFKTVVLAVDADGGRRNAPENLVELPGGIGSDKKPLSPERTLLKFIRALVEDPVELHAAAWADPRLRDYSKQNLSEHLLKGIPEQIDRKQAKVWWHERKNLLERWGLYQLWAAENQTAIATYEASFSKAVKVVAKRKRALEYTNPV